jgi:hypothetical protein
MFFPQGLAYLLKHLPATFLEKGPLFQRDKKMINIAHII